MVRCMQVAQPRPLKEFEGRMWLAVLATLGLSAQAVRVDICARYPNPDPCLPGGVWDPILNRYWRQISCVFKMFTDRAESSR